jgi:SAM-dependent methyltransferase
MSTQRNSAATPAKPEFSQDEPQCLCGSCEYDSVREGQFGFFPVDGSPVPFRVVACRNCHLRRTAPRPGKHIAFIAAGAVDQHSEQEEGEMIVATSRYRLQKILSRFGGPPQAVLEIGCSTGPLVELLEQAGTANSVGVELHAPAVAGALRRGRRVLGQSLEACAFQDGSFDLVQAHHVLEHVPDLHSLLDEVLRLLKPGGRCFFTVPCHDTPLARSDDWSGWFPQEHFWHFTQDTLLPVLAQHGLGRFRTSRPMLTDFVVPDRLTDVPKKLARSLVREIGWGDTLEVWAEKL